MTYAPGNNEGDYMEGTTEARRGAALVLAMRELHMSNGMLAAMVGVSVHTELGAYVRGGAQ